VCLEGQSKLECRDLEYSYDSELDDNQELGGNAGLESRSV
jgi:hypothetical protein